jgi:hypothetical protein
LRAKAASLECVIMKNFAVVIAAILLGATHAFGQVTVKILLESEQFIANEPLLVKVRISNDSGTTLHLAEDPTWLDFTVESVEGPYVRPLKALKVSGPFDLESSHTATTLVDLAPAFELTRPGKYKMVATVKVPAFNTTFASGSKSFYIVTGARLWEKEFGVPASVAAVGANGLPEVRKYILMQSPSGKDTRLFVRVTDKLENDIRVVPVGGLVSFSRPEPQLDKWSNLHLLYQTGAKSFNYSVVNADGFIIARETHEYSDTRPTLVVNDEGRIQIHGGNRRPSIDDIPPFEAAQVADLNADATSALRSAMATAPGETNAPAAKSASSASANAKKKKK